MRKIEAKAVAAKLKVAGIRIKIAGKKLAIATKELNEFQLSLLLHLILFLLLSLMPSMKVNLPKKTIKTMVPITLTEPRKRPVAGTSDRKKEGNSIQKPATPPKKVAKAPVKKAPAKKVTAKTTPNKTTPSKPEVKKAAAKPAQTKAAVKPVAKAESKKVEQTALKPPPATPKVAKPAEAPKPAKNTTPVQKQETKPAETPKAVQKQETKVAENVQPTPPLQTVKAPATADIGDLPIQPNPARELTRPLVAALPSVPSVPSAQPSAAVQAPSFSETVDFSFQPAIPEFQAPSSTQDFASHSLVPFLMEATHIESDSLLNSYFAETHDEPLPPKSGDDAQSDGVNVSFIENIGGDPIDSNVTLPRIINQIKPDFPEWARKEGVSGEASFKVLIRKSGMVGDVLTLSSTIHPKLALDCSKTLRRWMFSPMIKDGQPQDTWVKITVKYSLE